MNKKLKKDLYFQSFLESKRFIDYCESEDIVVPEEMLMSKGLKSEVAMIRVIAEFVQFITVEGKTTSNDLNKKISVELQKIFRHEN